ncbi:MAG: hypothetical protein V4613_02370 [Bacteroidota bacterium]
MRQLIIIASIFLQIGCTNNQKTEAPVASDTIKLTTDSSKTHNEEHLVPTEDPQIVSIPCNKTALDFLKLKDKKIQASLFHQIDSIRKVHYSNGEDTFYSFDITPKLLDKFIKDINKDQFVKTREFEKEYNFNIDSSMGKDPKPCKDNISISFEKKNCRFRLIIVNVFYVEWCHESSVVYYFSINGDRISDFWRGEAG